MHIVARQRIRDAGDAGMHIPAAEVFRAHRFAGRRLDQRRSGEKIVPCLSTMIVSSDIAGTYAPPAVQDPITTAI